jgi:hypothetical protein
LINQFDELREEILVVVKTMYLLPFLLEQIDLHLYGELLFFIKVKLLVGYNITLLRLEHGLYLIEIMNNGYSMLQNFWNQIHDM